MVVQCPHALNCTSFGSRTGIGLPFLLLVPVGRLENDRSRFLTFLNIPEPNREIKELTCAANRLFQRDNLPRGDTELCAGRLVEFLRPTGRDPLVVRLLDQLVNDELRLVTRLGSTPGARPAVLSKHLGTDDGKFCPGQVERRDGGLGGLCGVYCVAGDVH